ncbi:MAG: hypothetical protein COA71_11560 [SAR86 cluster bacterium]|uniref:Uncharacterized protein n=1 Tax=SAR86 cluster bacterium TaxID=2030880 RepID=A0A2A5C9I9_9GAMM|nr:hypothetical protein [bacterium AH-315-I11]MBN4059728.1 hypothetical protein [bacterium AH-315-I11]PCJ40141.1 MAG: hypothetical protein COA71_11560 [SAR86 cluster bacterium]
MKDPDKLELAKKLDEKNESIDASFYRVYCESESKWLGNWESDRNVAVNRKEYHKRGNRHIVNIYTRD